MGNFQTGMNAADPLEHHRFGNEADYSLGVEEELLLVSPDGARLEPACEHVLERLGGRGQHAHQELCAAMIEFCSPVSARAAGAVAALGDARRALADAGATVIAAGLHPTAAFGDAQLADSGRYRLIARQLRGLLRTPTAAAHVHVAMPDGETAIRVFNRMRRHVPVLTALAANSPFWHGIDSGLASARSGVVRSYPRGELPGPFESYEHFATTARSLAEVAEVPDYTYFWWDLRPHPRLGTLEVRALDSQTDHRVLAGLAALVQALAKLELEEGDDELPCREALAELAFRACRDGLSAGLVGRDGAAAPAREVARQTLQAARPHAVELGSEDALEELWRVIRDGNGCERQRAAHAAGGLEAVTALLLSGTIEGTWPQEERRVDPAAAAA